MSKFDEIYEHCKNEYSEGRSGTMTNEDAIEVLQQARVEAIACGLWQGVEVIAKCIEALEKQIPKKWIKGNVYRACPTCNHEMPVQRECCDHCGQRIDWSDEDAK